MKHTFDTAKSDFKCKNCNRHVTTNPMISGVNNRNHCPYCLYSKHVDLYEAGDRLAECKEKMKPIGLTVKKVRKKYGNDKGELMLIHQCVGCGTISINRIAADDMADLIMEVYQDSFAMDPDTRSKLETSGIEVLGLDDAETVRTQLYGKTGEPPAY